MVFFIPVRGGLTGFFSIVWVFIFVCRDVFFVHVRGGLTGFFSSCGGISYDVDVMVVVVVFFSLIEILLLLQCW